MKYFSTRGQVKGLSFQDAVLMGLADDGGLLIPETLPSFTERDLKHFAEIEYDRLAYEIMQNFVDDILDKDFTEIVMKTYAAQNFDDPRIIRIVKPGKVKIAELFHGPTFAFKDMALQFLGNLFEYILKKRNQKMNILGATSGDTGSAAIYGVKGKENINMFMLYPYGRISNVQELQMTTVQDKNIYCIAAKGSFDDCQNVVKTIFSDLSFKRKYNLGAVNSINWARILAQIVYYFYIYTRSVKHIGDTINIVVPTGNFGNIFAGFLARTMGLPIKPVLATNRNNILTRAVKFGDYSIERLRPSHSPAMDIQVASNFERYLYYLYKSTDKVSDAMDNFRINREIELRGQYLGQIQRDFIAADATDENIEYEIRTMYNLHEYIIDPHTACAVYAANKMEIATEDTICLATAHPAKFPEVIKDCLGFNPEAPKALQNMESLPQRNYKMMADAKEVKEFIEETLG